MIYLWIGIGLVVLLFTVFALIGLKVKAYEHQIEQELADYDEHLRITKRHKDMETKHYAKTPAIDETYRHKTFKK